MKQSITHSNPTTLIEQPTSTNNKQLHVSQPTTTNPKLCLKTEEKNQSYKLDATMNPTITQLQESNFLKPSFINIRTYSRKDHNKIVTIFLFVRFEKQKRKQYQITLPETHPRILNPFKRVFGSS